MSCEKVQRRVGLGARWVVAAMLMAPIASAAAQARVLRDPVLRPGDMLRITVWRHPEMSGDFAVAPDSTLVHPLYQAVRVAGSAQLCSTNWVSATFKQSRPTGEALSFGST